MSSFSCAFLADYAAGGGTVCAAGSCWDGGGLWLRLCLWWGRGSAVGIASRASCSVAGGAAAGGFGGVAS